MCVGGLGGGGEAFKEMRLEPVQVGREGGRGGGEGEGVQIG